ASSDPKVAGDQALGFPPDATSFRIGGCAWPTSVGNALAAVGAHRAERGIGFGWKLRSLLGHRAHQARGTIWSLRCDLHLDLYVRSLDAHGVSRNAAWGGRPEHCAGLDVVDGPMPRTRDLLARHLSLRKGA